MKKILVVDDEPAVARLVQMTLVAGGYDVVTATHGFEAMEKVDRQKPDLVVLDIMMPDISGYDICKELKNKPETRHIKVVFLTARGNPGDAQYGFKMGAEDYVVKPFDPEELLATISAVLEGAK